MKAIVWHGDHDFRYQDAPDPEVSEGRVVVKVEAAAICGSDLHLD